MNYDKIKESMLIIGDECRKHNHNLCSTECPFAKYCYIIGTHIINNYIEMPWNWDKK